MKPLRIDWDALDEAFHNQNDELVYYLDLVTGHVVLDGEGEDDDAYPDDDDEPVAPASTASASDPTRAYVEPPDTTIKIEWMKRFLQEAADLAQEHVAALRGALAAPEPAEALRDALNQNPDVRDLWYVFRSDRIHELIEQWLARNGVTTVEDPPWSA